MALAALVSLRKQAYSNILKILPLKNENFQIKNSDIFHNSAQNIDCGYSLELPRRGSSNEHPQSMFLIRNEKNNVYPCKPQFYYIKVGFKGVNIYRHVFMMVGDTSSWCHWKPMFYDCGSFWASSILLFKLYASMVRN